MADLEKNIKIGVDLSDLQVGVHEAINSIQGFWSSVEAGSRNSAQSFELMTSAFQSQSSVIQVGIRDTQRFSETFVQVQQTSQVALSSYSRDLATVQQEQESANASAKRWTESTKVVFGLLAQGAPAFFGKFITETINAEKQQAQLSAVLKSTGEAAGWSQERLNGMATSLSKSSVFSTGDITQAQTQLLNYSNVVGQQFPQAMQAVVDMSSRMGTSVTSSAETIGQALNSPSEGLKALADKGVQFTDQQKEMVAQLEATGQVGAAQAVILDALQTSYGGAAVAARDTLGGALEALQHSFATAMTGDSGSLQGMREGIESLNDTLSSEATREGFQTVIGAIAGVIEIAIKGISALGQLANAASLSRKETAHKTASANFDWNKKNYEEAKDLAEAEPGNKRYAAEAQKYYDAMRADHANMQRITASMQPPTIELPTVKVETPKITPRRAPSAGSNSAGNAPRESNGGDQEHAISGIKSRIAAEEDLIDRLKERAAAAASMSESDQLVMKLQKEIARTTDASTKANLQGQLVEAQRYQVIQQVRGELEKQIQTQDEASKSYLKYIDDLKKSASAIGDMADKQDVANANFGKSKIAIAEMAMEKARSEANNASGVPWRPEVSEGLAKVAEQHERYVQSLKEGAYIEASSKYAEQLKAAKEEYELQQYSMSLLGVEESQRQKLLAVRKAELQLAREIEQIKKSSYDSNSEKNAIKEADLIAQARLTAETKLQTELARIQDQYVTQQASKYADVVRQGFADFLNNGAQGLKNLGKSLKTTVLTSISDALYKAFAQKFVMNIGANITGIITSGVGWLAGLFGGGSGLGGSGDGAMSLLSGGSNAYSLYTGEGLLGQTSRYVGSMLGWGNTATFSAHTLNSANAIGMAGGDSLGFLATSSEAAGAGGSGMGSWFSGGGWVMSIPIIAAYLGGMFKEEKQVGSGLMGELGGDMYGYQLMRESGSLFGGPKYRYLAAEKEIEKANAQIETLQGQIAANPDAKENGYRERQLQQLYSRVEMLKENYGTAIEGSKGPIKVLQDAFKDMREDTAKKADTLGLNGDAIRAMKVALGLDEIHPDTGGKGLQLTGLSQEEASAKIQQALAQANEELARSVLGSWQEQTSEVTRMVWDNVQVAGDGDTEQWARVGRQVTETVTEQIFVMSEYVRTGETAVDALTRMSSSLVGVNQIFELFGSTLLEGSLSAGDWASKLVDAVGSMDALTQAASTYYDLYYSDDEKRSRATKVANDGMEERELDLRVGDVDAKKKYRALVDKAIADKDEELLAWLLQFADDFANGVDAVNASLEEGSNKLQHARETTLSTLGLSMDGLVDGFINEINEGRGAEAGSWLANQISAGFEQAVYEQAVNTILASMIDGMITPMLTAALTGANVADAVSGAAIDNMISNANAALQALNTLLTSTEFVEGMEKIKVTVKSLGNSIGVSIPKMRSYQGGVSSLGSSYDSSAKAANSAADAAKKLAEQWSKTIDAMSNEMKRLRGQLLGSGPDHGAAYYESLFAIKTAQARSGNQDAADELPSIIQALEELAKASATSQADVLLKQSAWLASLADTRNFLANKYGVDIGDVKTAEVGAATAGRVVQASGNTALLSALQASSDNPVLVAEVRALRLALDNHDANRKAEATVVVPAVQQLNKTLRMWDADGMPATRTQEENA
ncbi:phage tail length tape measure family protein [Comamonas squillarum]|uniref:Phage tail length tape measure family protein n=1 Tax=Comamonas squillarum TaxID=2977320 RepID=A0ABY6A1K8_9BURK|nr:phage tail length tape measure family protein [Comamonas sp. PR12]UXC20155.1 phage tail length tape measure family protein [Comamonas sp. PR12]